jgi:hypothetical protein
VANLLSLFAGGVLSIMVPPIIGLFLSAICFLLFVGGVIALVIWAIRKQSVGSQREGELEDRPPPPPTRYPRPRLGADGFWLRSANIRPGSTVHYRYRAGGLPRTGQIAYQPGPEGVFVYTGDPPEDVEIIDVRPPVAGSAASAAHLDTDEDRIDDGFDADDLPGIVQDAALPVDQALPAADVSEDDSPSETGGGGGDWSASEPPAY